MATAAFTNVPTTITLCDAVTGFTGDTFSLEPDIKVQGTNSVACAQTVNGVNDIIFTKATGSWDFSAGEHLRLWFNSSALPANGDTLANGGLQIGLSDGTNTDYFNVSGADVYGGGWEQIVLYTLTTPDVDNSANLAAITSITYRMNTLSKPRNVPANTWLDAWYYGDGYTVTGGTSGDPIDWSHIASVDKTNAYGVLDAQDDVYFGAGEITIGDGTSTTYFEPSGQKLQFRDLPVSSTLYKVIFTDSVSNLTNVTITSGAWGAAGTQRYGIDVSDTNINAFSLTGAQVANAGTVSFHAGATATSNVFNNCLQITPSTSTFQLNTISGYTSTLAALLAPSSTTNLKDNIYKDNTDITNSPAGIEYATVGSYTSNGDTFSGNDFDVLNSDNAATITAGSFVVGRGYKILTVGTTDYTLIGSADNVIGTKFVATGVGAGTGTATEVLVINKVNGANPSTANNTGTNADTLFVASFVLTLTNIPNPTNVTIVDSTTRAELSHATVTTGSTTYTHGGGGTVDILFNSLAYDPNLSDIYDLTLPNADSSIKVNPVDDTNYVNP